ncbi:hypothetical protein Bca4012_056662 [Brassica carinata]
MSKFLRSGSSNPSSVCVGGHRGGGGVRFSYGGGLASGLDLGVLSHFIGVFSDDCELCWSVAVRFHP